MADHSDFVEMAHELIREDGRQITLAQLSSDPADSDKPWNGPGSPTPTNTVSVYAVFVPVSSLGDLGMHVNDSELFKSSDEVCLVEPPVTNEDLSTYHIYCDGDSITGSDRRKINVVQVLKPGPTVVLYAMGASR